MPMYEYRCSDCGHVFEEFRKMWEADEPAECRQCASKKAERVMSAPSVFTGGSGSESAGSGCSPRGGFT